jgi:hypothetical protein
MEWRSVGGADAGGLGDVFDAEGQAFERAQRLARRNPCRGPPGGLAARVGNEGHDGIELRIEARDCREMRIEHLDRAHRPRAHHRGELDRRLPRQRVVGGHHLPDQCTNRRSTNRNIRLSP